MFIGTRVLVRSLFDYLEAGASLEDCLLLIDESALSRSSPKNPVLAKIRAPGCQTRSLPGKRVSPAVRSVFPAGKRVYPVAKRVSPACKRVFLTGKRVFPAGKLLFLTGKFV